jgi:hypothetical protein
MTCDLEKYGPLVSALEEAGFRVRDFAKKGRKTVVLIEREDEADDPGKKANNGQNGPVSDITARMGGSKQAPYPD